MYLISKYLSVQNIENMLRSRIGWVLFVTILIVALTEDNEVKATPVSCGADDFLTFRPQKHKKHPKRDSDNDDQKKDDNVDKPKNDDKDHKEKKKQLLDEFKKLLKDVSSTSASEQPHESAKRKAKSKGPMEEFFSDYLQFLKFLMFAK